MQIVTFIVALVLMAIFYSPVYLPFVISFKVKSADYREVRWALRIASVACLWLALTPPPRLRNDFGDDVGGNIAGAFHNFPITLAWAWGGGLGCIACCVLLGLMVRRIRRKNCWMHE